MAGQMVAADPIRRHSIAVRYDPNQWSWLGRPLVVVVVVVVSPISFARLARWSPIRRPSYRIVIYRVGTDDERIG